MVKVPKLKAGRRVIFRDAKGRFVPESERYQRATSVQRLYRGSWVTITEGGKRITPRRLAQLLPRDEFEMLAPNYSDPVSFRPAARKYTAWDVAGQISRARGVRGTVLRVELHLRDGRRLRKITFYRRTRRKGSLHIPVFLAINEAIGNNKMNLYNRIGSKLFPDRKGRTVRLVQVLVSKEL
jgi:hypothetical protein